MVACEIHYPWVVGREYQRAVPIKSELWREFGAFLVSVGKPVFAGVDGVLDGRIGEVGVGPILKIEDALCLRGDILVFSCFFMQAHRESDVVYEVEGVVVGRIYLGIEAVAFAHPGVVFIEYSAILAAIAGACPKSVVLQAAHYVVGFAHIGADGIVLADGHIVEGEDRFSAVYGQAETLVGSEVHNLVVVRSNPEVVVVAAIGMPIPFGEGSAAIGRNSEIAAYDVDVVGIDGVDFYLAVVVWTQGMFEEEFPAFTAVVGSVNAGTGHVLGEVVVGFIRGDEDVGVAQVDGQVDISAGAFGESFAEFAPGFTSVGTFIDTAIRAASGKRVRGAQTLVKGGEEHIGISGLEEYIGAAGFAVVGESAADFFPGFAPVSGLKKTPITGIAPQVAWGSYERDTWVAGVQGDGFDVASVLKTKMCKGFASVGRFIDSVAPAAGISVGCFSGSHPDNVWVLLVDSYRSDGAVAVLVENRCPGSTGISGFEYAAGSRRYHYVPIVCLEGINGSNPSHHIGGAYIPPAQGRRSPILLCEYRYGQGAEYKKTKYRS